jgi:hypothetical protein
MQSFFTATSLEAFPDELVFDEFVRLFLGGRGVRTAKNSVIAGRVQGSLPAPCHSLATSPRICWIALELGLAPQIG